MEVDDETTLAEEEEMPQADVQEEIDGLEGDANLPIEEVIRRMKARAADAGEDEEDEEDEEEDGEEDGEEEDGEEEVTVTPSFSSSFSVV